MSADRQSAEQKTKRGTSAASLANLTGGSRKGVPNKTTKLVKEAIAEAFDRLGGADRLVEWANEDPDNEKVFYTTLLPKLIPVQTELSGPDGRAIQFEEKVRENAEFVASAISGLIERAGTSSVVRRTEH